MKKTFYILHLLLFPAIFFSCSSIYDEIDDCPIEIVLSQSDFAVVNPLSATRAGAGKATLAQEEEIQNFYLFLFPTTSGQTLLKYYIDNPTFTGGIWSSGDNKITVDKTQAAAGTRDVYLIANCTSVKSDLDAVNTLAELQTVFSNLTPWSIGTPLLMEGHARHNFKTNYQLNSIDLIRAVAKLQVAVTLTSNVHQNSDKSLYQYRYLNFGNRTFVTEHAVPQDAGFVVSSPVSGWLPIPADSLQTGAGGKITHFNLVTTYINEYKDETGTGPVPVIEIALPYDDGGFLPPPEFGDGDRYRLKLPSRIVRNTIYRYDIEVGR